MLALIFPNQTKFKMPYILLSLILDLNLYFILDYPEAPKRNMNSGVWSMFPNAKQKRKERKKGWGERQLQNQHMTAGKWIDISCNMYLSLDSYFDNPVKTQIT